MRTVDFAFEINWPLEMKWIDSGKSMTLKTKSEDMNAISENTTSLFFSFFLSGSRIESFLLMSFSSPTLAFTEYIEESWLYFQGHHQSQRLYISWYVSSVKSNLYFRIVFRYHDLLSLRTLKRKIHPYESLFSRYSLALRGFWREKNRLLTFKVNKTFQGDKRQRRKICNSTEKLNPGPFNYVNFKVDTLMVSIELTIIF